MIISEKSKKLLALSKVKGVGRATVYKICSNYLISNDNDLIDVENIIKQEKLETNITQFKHYKKEVEQALDRIEKSTDFLYTILDEQFPKVIDSSVIKNSDKPFVLCGVGNEELLNSSKKITIIGTREPGQNAKIAIDHWTKYFAQNKNIIVSGLALGCDTLAHEGALKHGTPTIAILGNTLDEIEPRQNRKLADSIVESGGLLLSEYFEPIPLGKERYEYSKRLIERDRLQAMFSSISILVSSDLKGGSRHCMNKAKEYGIPRGVLCSPSFLSGNKTKGLSADIKIELNEQLINEPNVENSTLYKINHPNALKDIENEISKTKLSPLFTPPAKRNVSEHSEQLSLL